VRVDVIVNVFEPVSITPFSIFTVAALTLLCKINCVLAPVVLLLRILKVVAPVRYAVADPMNCTVLEPAVNVPLFVQLPYTECVKVDGLNVVPLPIVMLPRMSSAPAAVFVFPPESIRL
jgi:hypothetical protein